MIIFYKAKELETVADSKSNIGGKRSKGILFAQKNGRSIFPAWGKKASIHNGEGWGMKGALPTCF